MCLMPRKGATGAIGSISQVYSGAGNAGNFYGLKVDTMALVKATYFLPQ